MSADGERYLPSFQRKLEAKGLAGIRYRGHGAWSARCPACGWTLNTESYREATAQQTLHIVGCDTPIQERKV